jgi:hypothetical protein
VELLAELELDPLLELEPDFDEEPESEELELDDSDGEDEEPADSLLLADPLEAPLALLTGSRLSVR